MNSEVTITLALQAYRDYCVEAMNRDYTCGDGGAAAFELWKSYHSALPAHEKGHARSLYLLEYYDLRINPN